MGAKRKSGDGAGKAGKALKIADGPKSSEFFKAFDDWLNLVCDHTKQIQCGCHPSGFRFVVKLSGPRPWMNTRPSSSSSPPHSHRRSMLKALSCAPCTALVFAGEALGVDEMDEHLLRTGS